MRLFEVTVETNDYVGFQTKIQFEAPDNATPSEIQYKAGQEILNHLWWHLKEIEKPSK